MMFVPGYDHDVFVSYAHVDDEPWLEPPSGAEKPPGWVATLVRHLRIALARKIGRPDAFNVWFDQLNLRGNHQVTDEIATRLKSSATFFAILSPGYSASIWCQQEARLFTRHFADNLRNRVFIVEMSPLDDDAQPPPELSGRRNYRFWYPDRLGQPQTFAMPMPHQDEPVYFRLVVDVAHDIHAQLKVMGGSGLLGQRLDSRPVNHTPPRPASGGAVVLLAEVTDDLETDRRQVQRYLEQQKITVLPEQPYPLGRAEFELKLNADLRRTPIFVQLLGARPGKRPPDVPEGYGWLQLESARRHSGVKIMQWRNPDLDLTQIEWERHRELLEHETVQATTLETFKRAICDAVAPELPLPRLPTTGDLPLIFLNTERRHSLIADRIRAGLAKRAAWAMPLAKGSSSVVRKDLELNLLACDAMVMVYDDNPEWARAQLPRLVGLRRCCQSIFSNQGA